MIKEPNLRIMCLNIVFLKSDIGPRPSILSKNIRKLIPIEENVLVLDDVVHSIDFTLGCFDVVYVDVWFIVMPTHI